MYEIATNNPSATTSETLAPGGSSPLQRSQHDQAPSFRVAHKQALLDLGRHALTQEHLSTFLYEGCVAAILACIESGITERDEIVKAVPRHHSCSHRHVGFMLGQMAGEDPATHLWTKHGRNYRLLA